MAPPPRDHRDDTAAAKDILSQLASQLSKDEKTCVNELRKLALRGLDVQQQQQQQQLRQPQPFTDNKKVTHSVQGDSGNVIKSTTVRQVHPENKQSTPAATSLDNAKQDNLAFTISKDSDMYKHIFSTVQWYRDSYLIGSSYADQRSEERSGASREQSLQRGNHLQMISLNGSYLSANHQHSVALPKPDSETAIGYPLLLSVAENYLRTNAADLLRPYAKWVVSSNGGPLSPIATQSMAQSIPLGQSSCDWAMRENLLWVLRDEEWKEWAKSITTTYVLEQRSGRLR